MSEEKRTRTRVNKTQKFKETSDEVFNEYIKDCQKESEEEKLLSFVNEQIENMRKYTDLGNPQGMPGFIELNDALMNYNMIQTSLIGLDVMAKQESYKANEELKDKEAEYFIKAKQELNPYNISASKWYSTSEIESYVRVHYKNELRPLRDKASACEMKVAAIRRLLDSWSTQSLILNRLCKNVETEFLSMTNGKSTQ